MKFVKPETTYTTQGWLACPPKRILALKADLGLERGTLTD